MKNNIVLVAMFCLLFVVGAVSAQDKKTNFGGDWELDLDKSKMAERSRIESMTMKVTQSETDLTIETKAERSEGKSEGQPMGRRGGFGGGRGMLSPGSDQNTTYKLSGEETTIQSAGQLGGETKFKAESLKDGKMKLTQIRNLETPRGEITIKTVETWELMDGGKTLKIVRDIQTPRRDIKSEMIFVKK